MAERYGFAPDYFGGHSLGEFTALVAAGVMPLAETVKIVQTRGKLMQEAVPVGVGGMAAVISEDIDMEMLDENHGWSGGWCCQYQFRQSGRYQRRIDRRLTKRKND